MCGGLKYVINNIKVENLIVSSQKENYKNYREIIEIAINKNINILVVGTGDIIKIDNSSYIHILYPNKNLSLSDINNNSIVAKFICKDISILFTRRYRKRGRKWNFKNAWGKDFKIWYFKSNHTSKEIIKKLDKMNIKIYRTDEKGEINFIFNKLSK